MSAERDKTGRKARLLLAVGLSLLVVLAAGLNAVEAAKSPLSASLQDFGQWLSGVAGALAFIWLIVSYFQQGEELELQRLELSATREQLTLQKDEMARLADQAEKQATSAHSMEAFSRQNVFFAVYELILSEARGALIDLGGHNFSDLAHYVEAGDAGLQQMADELTKMVDSSFGRSRTNTMATLRIASTVGDEAVFDLNGTHIVDDYGDGRVHWLVKVSLFRRYCQSLSPLERLAKSTQQEEAFEELKRTSAFLRLRQTIQDVLSLAESNTLKNAQ